MDVRYSAFRAQLVCGGLCMLNCAGLILAHMAIWNHSIHISNRTRTMGANSWPILRKYVADFGFTFPFARHLLQSMHRL
jgi:hypothetical protein